MVPRVISYQGKSRRPKSSKDGLASCSKLATTHNVPSETHASVCDAIGALKTKVKNKRAMIMCNPLRKEIIGSKAHH